MFLAKLNRRSMSGILQLRRIEQIAQTGTNRKNSP
jgi:hypothetical protein